MKDLRACSLFSVVVFALGAWPHLAAAQAASQTPAPAPVTPVATPASPAPVAPPTAPQPAAPQPTAPQPAAPQPAAPQPAAPQPAAPQPTAPQPEVAQDAPPTADAAGADVAAEPAEPRPAPAQIYEPPLPAPYAYGDAPKPLPPRHVAPKRSFWLGARTGWFFPLGSLWQDGEPVADLCCGFVNRGFSDFASSGPLLELDLGARLGRHYNVFGIWEWGLLRDGDELGDDFGGQESARTHFLGVGLRFSTDPDGLGVLVEMALGWRQFSATWNSGTELTLTDDFLNTRIGVGADIRLNQHWSLEPMVTLGGGIFTQGEWRLSDGSSEGPFSPFDREAQHVPITLQVGIHYDAFRTED